MKVRHLAAVMLFGISCAIGSADAQQSAPNPAPPVAGNPAYSFNWFDPNAWMRMFYNPAAWTAQPFQGTPPANGYATGTATPYSPASGTFNWFDPNIWMSMFVNPAAWGGAGQPGSAATNSATPTAAGAAPTAYNSFNWFNPFAWAAMFYPAAYGTLPATATASGK